MDSHLLAFAGAIAAISCISADAQGAMRWIPGEFITLPTDDSAG